MMESYVVQFVLTMAMKVKELKKVIYLQIKLLLHVMDNNHHRLDHEEEVQYLEKEISIQKRRLEKKKN